eukprot:351532-Chlamydomonas_euryale.AAC.16
MRTAAAAASGQPDGGARDGRVGACRLFAADARDCVRGGQRGDATRAQRRALPGAPGARPPAPRHCRQHRAAGRIWAAAACGLRAHRDALHDGQGG